MDSVVFRNKLQHWYYLHDTVGYKKHYGDLPLINAFPNPVHHPDDLGDELLEKEKQYYPEFYN